MKSVKEDTLNGMWVDLNTGQITTLLTLQLEVFILCFTPIDPSSHPKEIESYVAEFADNAHDKITTGHEKETVQDEEMIRFSCEVDHFVAQFCTKESACDPHGNVFWCFC